MKYLFINATTMHLWRRACDQESGLKPVAIVDFGLSGAVYVATLRGSESGVTFQLNGMEPVVKACEERCNALNALIG